MGISNLNDRHFTLEEQEAVEQAIVSLNTVLGPKLRTLSADERSRYGSVNEQNKLIINKVMEFRQTQPELSSPDIDWDEFQKDYDSRVYLENLIIRIETIVQELVNSKILHGWDNYQATLIEYDFTKYKENAGNNGFEKKAKEIGQFFKRGTTILPRPDTNANGTSTPEDSID